MMLNENEVVEHYLKYALFTVFHSAVDSLSPSTIK